MTALTLVGLNLGGLAACSSGSKPPPPGTSATPTFTQTGKPGGTLRIVGTTRSVPLDPALARDDASLLVNRLVLRQLYSYGPGDTEPVPDLALGPPRLSRDRLTATISIKGNARWSVPGGRSVTSGDVLRSLKRLCAPSILAPERGYLSELVVGYADFCNRASRVRLGATRATDFDSVKVAGLQAVGDGEVQIRLRRPAADLAQILALPALSPLPFEIREGFGDPDKFIGDGPYRFATPEAGEGYRLSRNSVWDPASDQLRQALVDRVTFRGGLSPADVEQRLERNDADLSWDAETAPEVLNRPGNHAYGLARVDDRALALLAVGTRGSAARVLAAAAARGALSACLDRSGLARAFGGNKRASVLTSLLPPGAVETVPGSSESAPSTPLAVGGSASPTQSAGVPGAAPGGPGTAPTRTPAADGATGGPTSSPAAGASAAPSAVASPASKPLSPAACRAALSRAGLRPGTRLTLLAADTADERAAATSLRDRLNATGLVVTVNAVPEERYAASAAAGGWDLALFVERPDYLGTRAVLAPLLDPRWPSARTLPTVRRSPAWLTEMAASLGEQNASTSANQQLALAATIQGDGALMPLAGIATVRTMGPNVGQIPPVPLLGNADPANVALGVTRPGESSSSAPPPS